MKTRGISRINQKPVPVGNIFVGGGYPIRIQSMTNAPAKDIQGALTQCMRCFDLGADMMRMAVFSKASLKIFTQVKKHLRAAGYNQPLIADIHFEAKLALEAARIADKVRINPGNYLGRIQNNAGESAEMEAIENQLAPFIEVCRQHETTIRIGVNAGSLSPRMIQQYGRGPRAMAESAITYQRICSKLDFHRLVISLKASNPFQMVQTHILALKKMKEMGLDYPFHLGVTESGTGREGKIKSAVGLYPLLMYGIGDTIRVSLTGPPETEVGFAKILLDTINGVTTSPKDDQLIADMGKTFALPLFHLAYPSQDMGDHAILSKSKKESSSIEALAASMIKTALKQGARNAEDAEIIVAQMLQAAGIKNHDTEFISCPACARTVPKFETLVGKVKEECSGYPGVKIAIMGCLVNGPGEMEGADYGIMGGGNDHFYVYKNSKKLSNKLALNDAVGLLKELLAQQ